jgi:hypothetical protein
MLRNHDAGERRTAYWFGGAIFTALAMRGMLGGGGRGLAVGGRDLLPPTARLVGAPGRLPRRANCAVDDRNRTTSDAR